MCTSHFASFSVFLAIFQVLSCEFLIFLVGQFSRHIPGPTVCVFHFARFSVFLAIFQVLPCEFLIFPICQVSCQNPGFYCVYFSFCKFFSVSCHIRGPTVCVSLFARFSVFLTKVHVLTYVFLIFLICQFSPHISGQIMFVSHFPSFSVFLAICNVLPC